MKSHVALCIGTLLVYAQVSYNFVAANTVERIISKANLIVKIIGVDPNRIETTDEIIANADFVELQFPNRVVNQNLTMLLVLRANYGAPTINQKSEYVKEQYYLITEEIARKALARVSSIGIFLILLSILQGYFCLRFFFVWLPSIRQMQLQIVEVPKPIVKQHEHAGIHSAGVLTVRTEGL